MGMGDGCYGDGRWLLWGWEMVAMGMGVGCYGDLVTVSSSRSSNMTFARLFFIFAKSNSSLTLVDLIFLLILSIHMTLILSYPNLHVHSHTIFIFPSKCAGYFMTFRQRTKETTIYSYPGGRSSSANSKATWVPTNSSGNTWISSSMGTS